MRAIEDSQLRQQKEGRSKLQLSNKTIKRMQHMKPFNKPSTWLTGDTALFLTKMRKFIVFGWLKFVHLMIFIIQGMLLSIGLKHLMIMGDIVTVRLAAVQTISGVM